jgi:serine/threonine protein kinase
MELCEGGDLASYIERSGRVEEGVARNFMRQIGKLIDPSAVPNCSSNFDCTHAKLVVIQDVM